MACTRSTIEERISGNDLSKRDIPSFIEPLPPLISNPFMRPKPVKGTNLLELFEEDSECEDSEFLQVYLRIKPCNAPSNLYEVRSEKCLVTSMDTATVGHGRRTQHCVNKMYTFSRVFGPESTQKEIFENVVKDNLRKLPDGYNYTLLTYGASGSGKTYTLMGTVTSPGLVPRSLEYLFKIVDAAQQPLYKPSEGGAEKLSAADQEFELQCINQIRRVPTAHRDKYRRMSTELQSDFSTSSFDLANRTTYYVWVSFVEIYNEAVYDLLATSDRQAAVKLRIREDAAGHVFVQNATQAFVRSGIEAYDALVAGKLRRQEAATGVHAHSSRSHCIFTITLLTSAEGGRPRSSFLRLCDLAGAERAARTRNTGARLHESRAINSSLHALERALRVLRGTRASRHRIVPTRESKLTRLLGAGLSGKGGESVSMVVTMNPSAEDAQETRHVLQLAAVAKDIQVNSTMTESSTFVSVGDTTVAASNELKLRADIERLHFELAQCESRNKELLTKLESRQQQSAATMRDIVKETKDTMRQFYEGQISSLREQQQIEIEELTEEYESKLRGIETSTINKGTPPPSCELVTPLETELAILEEKLNAEKLARVRAEEEVQYLHQFYEGQISSLREQQRIEIEELTEEYESKLRGFETSTINKGTPPPSCELVTPLETELAILEEKLNAEKLARVRAEEEVQYLRACIDERDDKGSQEELKTCQVVLLSDEEQESDNEINQSLEPSLRRGETLNNIVEDIGYNNYLSSEMANDTYDSEKEGTSKDFADDDVDECKAKVDFKRGTYAVTTEEINASVDSGCNISNNKESKDCTSKDSDDTVNVSFKEKNIAKVTKTSLNKLNFSTVKNSVNGNESLAVFEQFEKEVKTESRKFPKHQDSVTIESIDSSMKLNILKVKRAYFESIDKIKKLPDQSSESSSLEIKTKKTYFDDYNPDMREKIDIDDKKGIQNNNFHDSHILAEEIKLLKVNDIPEINISKQKSPESGAVATSIEEFGEIKMLREKRTYFDNISENIDTNVNEIEDTSEKVEELRSPSIIKDDIPKDYEPSTIKKMLGDSRNSNLVTSMKNKVIKNLHESLDIFDEINSPRSEIDITKNKSLEKMAMVQERHENCLHEETEVTTLIKDKNIFKVPATIEINEHREEILSRSKNMNFLNDTETQFENIYNDVSLSRTTEFDLLLTRELNDTNLLCEVNVSKPKTPCEETSLENDSSKPDLLITEDSKNDNKGKTNKDSILAHAIENSSRYFPNEEEDTKAVKYNLRHKNTTEVKGTEINLKSALKTKRSLRLKRTKNEEKSDDEENKNIEKLRDIKNLEQEFADVMMDMPVTTKVVKDIPSPKKSEQDEDVDPIMGIQSCPSKRYALQKTSI